MDVNFMKMHNPNNPAPKFAGKSKLGRYSDSVMEMDDNVGRIMEAVRQVSQHDRGLHGRQRRLAGRVSGRRHAPVPRRKGNAI